MHEKLQWGQYCLNVKGAKAKLHLVTFFSSKLSPAEKNYDIGDHKLLAIKSALEERRFLLQGAAYLVLIYKYHTNVKYLRAAKHLKPHQARWALSQD